MVNIAPIEHRIRAGQVVTLRSATPQDATMIISYMQEMLRTSPGMVTQQHEYNVSVADQWAILTKAQNEPGHLFLVAIIETKLVGLLTFSNGIRERNRHVGSFTVSVQESYRREGIASRLVEELFKWVSASSLIEKVGLSVFENNPSAIRLYEKFDFQLEGRRIREYRVAENEYVDDLLMYKFVKKPEQS